MLLLANREPGANPVYLWSMLKFPANRYFSPRVPKQALTRAPDTHGSGLGMARRDCSKGALLGSCNFPSRAAPGACRDPQQTFPTCNFARCGRAKWCWCPRSCKTHGGRRVWARSGPVVPAHVALPAMAQQESVFFLLKGAWAKSIKTSWEGTADTSSASSRSITPGGREKIPRPVVLARASPRLTPVPRDECFYKAELERKHCAINLGKAAPNIPAARARAALDQRGSCTHGCGHAKARAAAEEQLGRLSQPTEILVPFQRLGFT